MPVSIRLQQETFDPGTETNLFLATADGMGAAVTFTGLVRSKPDDPIESLTLEHYGALAEAQLTRMADNAVTRFELSAVTIIHRYGTMRPNEPIVQVMTLSSHRQAAFDGASFLMDYLKTDAPFWKKEERPGQSRWVDATGADDKARARWSKP